MKNIFWAFVSGALSFSLGCTNHTDNTSKFKSGSASALRPLTSEERSEDFEAIAQAVKDLYGPTQFKENRFGFKVDALAGEYREQVKTATTDEEAFGVYKKFLTRLQDGHVSLAASAGLGKIYSVPLFISPVEDKAIVVDIDDKTLSEAQGIEVGDEVQLVDGKPPFELLPVIRQYITFGNELSDRHFISRVLKRPVYMKELVPSKPTVALQIQKKDGSIIQRSLVWKFEDGPADVNAKFAIENPLTQVYSSQTSSIIKGSLNKEGDETPFYMSDELKEKTKMIEVTPSEKFLKKYGIEDATKAPKLFAALYKYKSKTLLLVRVATYSVKDIKERLAWYEALLEEYGALADALVLDQTHNPGGDLDYAAGVVSLFAKENTRGLVNFLHADRRWLKFLGQITHDEDNPEVPNAETRNVLQLGFKLVEQAYDKGQITTATPVSLGGSDYLQPAKFVFKDAPILMLVDELAGSCGDIVPKLMKDNHLAVLFGERTIGLGGNVEPVLELPNSRSELRLTRGLFTTFSPDGVYGAEQMIENNGVTPDIHYTHTVKDVREGYMDYVTAFSDAAVGLIK